MKHLTSFELAKRWRLKEGTLRNWRSLGRGPAYIKLGDTDKAAVAYPLASIEDYESKHSVKFNTKKPKK